MNGKPWISQTFSEENEFALKNFESSQDDLFWRQGASALNSEDETRVVFSDDY